MLKLRGREANLTEKVILSIGSNINPKQNLQEAIQRVGTLGELLGIAAVYQNPALGADGLPSNQADFLNSALLLETDLDLASLRQALREIEREMGRVRSTDKFAAREIDLDICLFGEKHIKTEETEIPDPDLLAKAHLAVPIAELIPDWVHPVTNQTLRQIADQLKQDASLTRIEMDFPLKNSSGVLKPDPTEVDESD